MRQFCFKWVGTGIGGGPGNFSDGYTVGYFYIKNSDCTPIAKEPASAAGGIHNDQADNFSALALYAGKSCANALFGFYQFRVVAALNNSGNTTETTRAHPALKSTRCAAIPKAAGVI